MKSLVSLIVCHARRSSRNLLFAFGLGLLSVHSAYAGDANSDLHSGNPEQSPWHLRVGALDALYDSSATIKLAGTIAKGATAHVSNGETVIVDVGYDVTKNVSLLLMAGYPPEPTISGRGIVTSLNTLGKVRYGSTILTGIYHFRDWGRIEPYVGAGAAYAIILHPRDGSIVDLGVHNNFGLVLQAGAEYPLDDTWGLFADIKKVWLSVDAQGRVGGAIPVTATVKLNPVLMSAGVTVHFN